MLKRPRDGVLTSEAGAGTAPSWTMVLDTETSGLPTRSGSSFCGPPTQTSLYDSARLIELAYILIDSKTKEEIRRESFLVKPTFPITNSHIHGITQELAERDGVDLSVVFEALRTDMALCSRLVAHNAEFDTHILRSECYRAKEGALAALIESKQTRCTMKMGTIGRRKWPKLTELHARLLPSTGDTPIVQTHRALADTELCLACYRILTTETPPPVLVA